MFLHCRLYEHTKLEENAVCTSDALYHNYVQYCEEAHLSPVSSLSFRKSVTTVHGITTTQAYVQGERKYVYCGLTYTSIRSDQHFAIEAVQLPQGWYVIERNDTHVYAGFKTGIYKNSVEVIKEIKIHPDSSVEIIVNNHAMSPNVIGLPQRISDTRQTSYEYIEVITKCNICIGYECELSETEYFHNGLLYRTRCSPSCSILLHNSYRGNVCHRCQVYKFEDRLNKLQPPTDQSEVQDIHHDDNKPTNEATGIDDIFSTLFPSVNLTLADFLWAQSQCSQQEAEGVDPRQRRWPRSLITLSLKLYISSPTSYRFLAQVLYLPSEQILQMYKNTVNKEPGINQDMLCWAMKECDRTNTVKRGGIIFDEMTIQTNIQFEPQGEGLRMFGGVDFGPNNNGIHDVLRGNDGFNMATSILQFVFLAFNGFRFPVCYIANKGITAGEIASVFWDLLNTMKTYGFHITYICMDGASINRAFQNMICIPGTYIGRNISTLNEQLACIMDCSHVIKKIRNSLYSSGCESHHRRHLTHPLGTILWVHFKNAYLWDRCSNYLRVHRRLTPDHFNLNSSLKMRNHLAEHVLNTDMLFLVKQYQQSLADGSCLNAVISLLEVTSKYISIYRSRDKILTLHDSRLDILREILRFFCDWELFCKSNKTLMTDNKHMFITSECFEDLKSSILGFIELCKLNLPDHPISPHLINSDICENIFCQQRTMYSGANTNPDAYQYRYVTWE